MNKGNKTHSKNINTTDQQVEELLKAAQDDVLLKLSVNSHLSRVAPDYLPSDLDRRFRALKTPSTQSPPPNPISKNQVIKEEKEDDLFARFSSLKGSTSISQSSSDRQLNTATDGGDDEEDEVEKLIKWAVDAARLDPSPPSDDDDDNDDNDDNDCDSEEENGKEVNAASKKKKKC